MAVASSIRRQPKRPRFAEFFAEQPPLIRPGSNAVSTNWLYQECAMAGRLVG
jgi:hypothetical protein